jgi:hypothetical protein
MLIGCAVEEYNISGYITVKEPYFAFRSICMAQGATAGETGRGARGSNGR